jgi:hypothetical protein
MPYIVDGKRLYLDDEINALARAIEAASSEEGRAGNLNYSITRLIDRLYDRRYSEINDAVGVLECVKLEFYRRVAAPYEDKKCVENGDVYR